MPVQYFLKSIHYQVEQLIFLFSHQSLLNNMCPNHQFSVAILRMKSGPGEIATPLPSLPHHSLQFTNCSDTTPSPSMPCHTVSNSPIALMPPLHHTCPTTQSLGASSPIALKASESSPPVAAFLISQMECLGGGLNAGRPLVGAFNFSSG